MMVLSLLSYVIGGASFADKGSDASDGNQQDGLWQVYFGVEVGGDGEL